jgi:fused signal recognition particle receptor
MFDGLKKKFSNFVNSFSKSEEERAEGASHAQAPSPETQQEKQHGHIPAETAVQKTTQPQREAEGIREAQPEPGRQESEAQHRENHGQENIQYKAEEAPAARPASINTQEKPRKEKSAGIKLAAATRIKGTIFGQVKISERDLSPFLDELMNQLILSDVNYSVAEKITELLRKNLLGKEIHYRSAEAEIRSITRTSLLGILSKGQPPDIYASAKAKADGGDPYKILFIGPNGAGKTTTMAKLARAFTEKGFTCIISASDTFRAAAIEQAVFHAEKLGIKAVKGSYGADPASVAFDAIAHAKAQGINVVLIDSAGRQETNRNLIEELKKMVRVTKPDMKIFVGESIAGNAILEQVSRINAEIGIDGIILTKLDCDAKGGNTLSILGELEIPILYFGTGEGYGDIMPYDPYFILDNIVPNT